jgi:hypothetical protein
VKSLLLKSLILFIPLLIFCCCLESQLGKIRNSYNYKKECLDRQADSIEILILGSSQANEGINPNFIKARAFNLANMSQSLYYDTKLALKAADRLPHLKYVIITLSYFSFGYEISDGIESWKDYYYSQFWGIDRPELPLLDLRRYSKVALYSPGKSLMYMADHFKTDMAPNLSDKGYLKIEKPGDVSEVNDSLGFRRVKFHDLYWRDKRVPQNIACVEELIAALKKRSVVPILVTMPVYETYAKFANKDRMRNNDSIIQSICARYDCAYYDYFQDKRFELKDFHDNDHLNNVGAEKMSRIIDREILKNPE